MCVAQLPAKNSTSHRQVVKNATQFQTVRKIEEEGYAYFLIEQGKVKTIFYCFDGITNLYPGPPHIEL
jgi:hypothetical protein